MCKSLIKPQAGVYSQMNIMTSACTVYTMSLFGLQLCTKWISRQVIVLYYALMGLEPSVV